MSRAKSSIPSPADRYRLGWAFRYGHWFPPMWNWSPTGIPNFCITQEFCSAMGGVRYRKWQDFFIEREMIVNPRMASSSGSMGFVEHFKKMVSIILDPENDGVSYGFQWNPYAERIVENLHKHRLLGIAGHASSSKTQTGVIWGLFNFLLYPTEVRVIITSTSLKDSKLRVWGVTRKYWDEIKNFFGGEEFTPGKMVFSEGIIRSTAGGKEDELTGLVLIGAGQNGDAEASTKVGFKGRRMIVIGDEWALLKMDFYNSATSNLQSNKDVQIVAISNPTSHFDPFGRFVEPLNGWDSVDENSEEWETKIGGYCIKFDGHKSPNVLSGREIWKGILTLDSIRAVMAVHGSDSLEYWKMIRGFFSPTGNLESIFTMPFISRTFATQNISAEGWWAGKKQYILSLDPAFKYGGDKAIATLGCIGETINPATRVQQVILEFTNQFSLAEKANSKDSDRTDQIIDQFVALAKQYNIPPEGMAIDATGGAADLAVKLADKLKSPKVLNVMFGGTASNLLVLPDDKRTGVDMFSNRVSELWYVAKILMERGQLKGVPASMITDLVARTYTSPGKRVLVEKKSDMKSRIGRSPDYGDSGMVLVELARQRYGLSPMRKVVKTGPQTSLESLLRQHGVSISHDRHKGPQIVQEYNTLNMGNGGWAQ